MRIRITHRTAYSYGEAPASAVQVLRLAPRSHASQRVARWWIDLDGEGRLKAGEDAFGNIVHVLSVGGPIEQLAVTAEGEVDTLDAHGVVQGAVERFPAILYLRETALTAPDPDLTAFADEAAGEAASRGEPLSALHALLAAVHETVAFDKAPTDAATTAAQAFALRRGVCQDLTHIFIVAARHLGIPARYVSGYALQDDGAEQEAGHAWAEAHVEGLGWVAFDPTHGLCPTEAHVRTAIGLDYLGAAPVRGSYRGGADERLDVSIRVAPARVRVQSQSQAQSGLGEQTQSQTPR